MTNPLLEEFKTPYKSIPFNLIKTVHFKPAIEKAIEGAKSEIDAIINNPLEPTFENTVEVLEKVGDKLSVVAKTLFNLNSAYTSEEIQNIASEISPKLTEFQNSITLNEKLFKRIQHVYKTENKERLKPHQQKLLTDAYKQFKRNGAELSPGDKEKYHEISKELSILQVQFNKNVLAETNAYTMHITDESEISGLPDDKIEIAAAEAKNRNLDGWIFTLQFPSFSPFLKYADSRARREEIWRAYSKRCLQQNENNNTEVVRQIVNLRLQKAKLLGFNSYADYVLSDRMAEKTENVNKLSDQLFEAAKPLALKEFEELVDFASQNGFTEQLMPWDITYWSEKLKKEKFDFDDEVTRPYFQLPNVVKGVFSLATRLFDLSFTKLTEVPVYDEQVEVYKVEENGKFKALLYLDFFARENKQGGAWMTDYKEQHNLDGNDERPHVSLVFNFSKPIGDTPTLLSHQEVTTVLHEFGHALHGMLSEVQYSSQAGTNVYRDFVELPSQLIENFGYSKEWINEVAVHYQTQVQIPSELVEKIILSREFFEGYATLRQLGFGLTDMAWHSLSEPFTGDINEYEENAAGHTRLLPKIPGTSFSPSFSHIFGGGYASGYYGYKWAEVLDADAFEVFTEKGVYNKVVAEKFKTEILSKGGTKHPKELYRNFKGSDAKVDALLKRMGALN